MKNMFERTEKEVVKELKGQAALVLEALDSHEGPQTIEAITQTIVDLGLVTRQNPERIASYYLCIFKKQGLVRTVAVETPAAEVADESENGLTAEENAEILTDREELELTERA